jgi:hypothetical protein
LAVAQKPKLKTLEQIAQDPVWLTRYRSWRELRRSEGKPTDLKFFQEWNRSVSRMMMSEAVASLRGNEETLWDKH